MKVLEYQARWRTATLTGHASAQAYVLALCELVGLQKPAELDPAGTFFTCETSIGKAAGGAGLPISAISTILPERTDSRAMISTRRIDPCRISKLHSW